jgi:hypothetical protein
LRQAIELTRIKALAEKTVSNGCTEAEAIAAAEMVGRRLQRYALSMEEIDVREARCVCVEVAIGGRQRRPIDGCVTAIARFCDCKVWIARDAVVPSYVFFGFESDAELASYLYDLINHAMGLSWRSSGRRIFSCGRPGFAVRRRASSRAWRHASPTVLLTCTRRGTPLWQHNARRAPRSC